MAIVYAECVQGDLLEKPLEGVEVWVHPKLHVAPYVAKTDSSGKAQIVAPVIPFWLSEPVHANRDDLEGQTAIAWGDVFSYKFVWKAPKKEGGKAGRGEDFSLMGLFYDILGEPDWRLILVGLVCLIGLAILAWGIRPYAKIAAKVA